MRLSELLFEQNDRAKQLAELLVQWIDEPSEELARQMLRYEDIARNYRRPTMDKYIYRGLALDNRKPFVRGTGIEIEPRWSLESWTTDEEHAASFAYEGKEGVVLLASPRRMNIFLDVYAFWRDHPFPFNPEGEILVFPEEGVYSYKRIEAYEEDEDDGYDEDD